MTREEFNKLYLGKAVHCDTEEKANEFLALADSVGYEWVTKMWLVGNSQWERYKEETCYEVARMGFLLGDVKFYKDKNYEIIEYQSQLKLKAGDEVRVKDAPYTTINGKVGVIVELDSSSPIPYSVKINGDDWIWHLTEDELEKVEEQICKEETIDDIIEIKTLYDEVLKLRNRLSNDGSGEVFEEDHLLLDCVLDLIEKEMKEDV